MGVHQMGKKGIDILARGTACSRDIKWFNVARTYNTWWRIVRSVESREVRKAAEVDYR